MSIDINGIAHVFITVEDYDACLGFYKALLKFFSMECLVDTPGMYYCVGGRTGIGIRAASEEHAATEFDQYRAGLHHLCVRARAREDIDAVAVFVEENGGRIVKGPQDDDWAPGYYSVLFEDPSGTRLEVNFVPGKGNLAEDIRRPLSESTQAQLSRR